MCSIYHYLFLSLQNWVRWPAQTVLTLYTLKQGKASSQHRPHGQHQTIIQFQNKSENSPWAHKLIIIGYFKLEECYISCRAWKRLKRLLLLQARQVWVIGLWGVCGVWRLIRGLHTAQWFILWRRISQLWSDQWANHCIVCWNDYKVNRINLMLFML